MNAIDSSICYGGNPRLIQFAIRALEWILQPGTGAVANFESWQLRFASSVTRSKFAFDSLSGKYPQLIGRSNLLLEASCDAKMSNARLANHYAFRAVAHNGEASGTIARLTLQNCAGLPFLES